MTARTVTCPYCHAPAELVDSAVIYHGRSFGMAWLCRPCDAWVGCHKDSPTHAPLGRLANKELRQWKQKAHAAFDPLWKRAGTVPAPMRRKDAYRWIQETLGLSPSQAHIGQFDVAECQRLIEACIAFTGAAQAVGWAGFDLAAAGGDQSVSYIRRHGTLVAKLPDGYDERSRVALHGAHGLLVIHPNQPSLLVDVRDGRITTMEPT